MPLLNGVFDEDGFSPIGLHRLHVAAMAGDLAAMKRLLDEKADVNVLSRGHNGVTPFYRATVNDQIPVMDLLFEHKADLTGVDSDGWFAKIRIPVLTAGVFRSYLMCAANYANAAVVRWLLAHKVDINVRATKAVGNLVVGSTALDIALFFQYEEIVNLLSAASAPPAPEAPFPATQAEIATTTAAGSKRDSNAGATCSFSLELSSLLAWPELSIGAVSASGALDDFSHSDSSSSCVTVWSCYCLPCAALISQFPLVILFLSPH